MSEVIGKYTVHLTRELGRGGFGTVYKGSASPDGTVAVKRINKKYRTRASKESVLFHSMKNIRPNDHIITVYDVLSHKDSMWIMMDYCDLGDLNQFFKKYKAFCQDLAMKIYLMNQIASGIAFLHSQNVVHRDVKPENILLKFLPHRYALVKLGDFGLSKFLDPTSQNSVMNSNVGTNLFKAPEFWNHKPGAAVEYDRNIDVYSAGLTFTAMLQAQSDRNLVPKTEGSLTQSETNLAIGLAVNRRIASAQPEFAVVEHQPQDDECTREIKTIIQEMTNLRPKKRLAASAVKEKLEQIQSVSCEKYLLKKPSSVTNIVALYMWFSLF